MKGPTGYIFRQRGGVLLTGTASGIRGAQETSVANGAAGAAPVSTCRVFQAWVSLGEPSADPLSTWGKQFCSIALTYLCHRRYYNLGSRTSLAACHLHWVPTCGFGSLRSYFHRRFLFQTKSRAVTSFGWHLYGYIYTSTQRITYTREVASSNRTTPVTWGISNCINGREVN